MKNTFAAATVAVFAASAAASAGGPQVVHACGEQTVYLAAVSSTGECQQAQLTQDNDSWVQPWTQTSTGGWSIKLSTEDGGCYPSTSVTQYEYSMTAPPTIWWDMSDVNGNPFDSWAPYSSCETCPVVTKAYANPDDNAAMQSPCDDTSAVITILLCSESDSAPAAISKYNLQGSGSAVSSVASSATSSTKATSTSVAASSTSKAAASTTSKAAASTTSSVEAYSTSATSSAEASSSSSISSYEAVEKVVATPAATTLATSAASSSAEAVSSPATTASADSNVVWVTDIQTAWQTDHVVHTVIVDGSGNTVTENKHKRHEHRHPHGRHH